MRSRKPSWMSELEWADSVNAGLAWCHRDQAWEPADNFGVDRTHISGRTSSCRRSLNQARRASRRRS